MEILKSCLDFVENWGALIIAAISLLIAGISLAKSSKAQNIQTQVNELDLHLKQYELESIEKKRAEANKACVEARIIKTDSGKHRLKIWNSGSAIAYNVRASFDRGSNIMNMDSKKLPYDELEPNKDFELALITFGKSASKFKVTTEWTDADGMQHSNSQMGDI